MHYARVLVGRILEHSAAEKVVFSRTLREVTWKNARLAKGTTQAEVAALKARRRAEFDLWRAKP